MRSLLSSCLTVCLCLCLTGTACLAQGPKRPPRLPRNLKTSAVLKGLGRGMLLVTAEDGKNWMVSIPNRPEQVVYQATASPGWLQRGMVVRFEATLDKRLNAQDAVSELTVITIRPGVEPGITVESDQDERADLFVSDKDAAKKKQRQTKGPITRRCLVVGRLLGSKGNKMTIAAGRSLVHADLAPTAQVAVDVNDLRLARPGDKVELSARYFEGAPGRAQGQQVTITAAQPLVAATRKAPGRGRSKREANSRKTAPEKGSQAVEVAKENKQS